MAKVGKLPKATQKASNGGRAEKPRMAEAHEILLEPSTQSAAGIQAFGKFAGEINLEKLSAGLREQFNDVLNGDMRRVEIMLYGQSVFLQTLFTSLARRGAAQEYLAQYQAYMKLALKAQAQCCSTLQALAEIKNPRPVFVGQNNIANGPQQVNNQASRTGKTSIQSNEQSGGGNELLEDTRASATASAPDPAMETLGAVNRAEIASR